MSHSGIYLKWEPHPRIHCLCTCDVVVFGASPNKVVARVFRFFVPDWHNTQDIHYYLAGRHWLVLIWWDKINEATSNSALLMYSPDTNSTLPGAIVVRIFLFFSPNNTQHIIQGWGDTSWCWFVDTTGNSAPQAYVPSTNATLPGNHFQTHQTQKPTRKKTTDVPPRGYEQDFIKISISPRGYFQDFDKN